MNVFQIILMANLALSSVFFITGMVFLKASGINPLGKRRNTKNKLGILTLAVSTIILFFLWIAYIINTDISLHFFSLEFLTKSLPVKWTAIAIMTIATSIEIISGLTLGKSGRIHSPEEKTKLIDKGIYGIIRNPIVLGMFLYGSGILLLNPNILSLFMIILLFYGYNCKVNTEAEKLKEIFGDEWKEYCKKTGKYLPELFSK